MKKINPVTAAGGVLSREREGETEVLLILRRGVWDLPKGKIEEGETIPACARREVAEEVGCTPPELHEKLVTTYHEYEEEGKLYGKTTHWFAMQTEEDENFTPEKREGIEQVKWFPLSEARNNVAYQNLIDVLNALENGRSS